MPFLQQPDGFNATLTPDRPGGKVLFLMNESKKQFWTQLGITLVLAIIVLSLIFKNVNDELLTGFLVSIAITTAVIAVFFMLISDIIIFL